MNRAAVVLALVLLTTPAMAPGGAAQSDGGDATATTTDWPEWYNGTLNVRVPITPSLGPGYPSGWDGPRLVTHELDVTQALIDAGWPTDAATGEPQRFTLDPDSLRVIPLGVEAPDPTPAVTWQGALLSEKGTHPTGHRIVTLAFLADPDVDTYHVYFDRTQDDDSHEPVPRDQIAEQEVLQLLAGPGSGHELVGAYSGTGTLQIASPYATTVTVQTLTSQGWSAIGCSGASLTKSPSSWPECDLPEESKITAVRVQADKPVTAFAWNPNVDLAPFIPLASEQGTPDGTTLMAPAPYDQTQINLLSLGEPCQAKGAVSGKTTQVSSGAPSVIEVSRAERIEAECPIIGWIPGHGPGPMPMALNRSFSHSGMTMSGAAGDTTLGCTSSSDRPSNSVVVVGDQGASPTLVNAETQEPIGTRLLLPGSSPVRPEHDSYRGGFLAPSGAAGTGHTFVVDGRLTWASVWDADTGVLPLAPTTHGSIGWLGPVCSGNNAPDVFLRVAGVPFSGSPRLELDAQGERLEHDEEASNGIPVSDELSYGEEADVDTSTNGGALVETGLQGELRLTAGFAFIRTNLAAPGQVGQLPSTLAAHLRPMQVERGDPQVIGPLFNIELDPESRIAAPGAVQSFDLIGRGQIRSADGSIEPLTVTLNVDSTTDTEGAPSLEQDIGRAEAELPVDAKGKITTVTTTVPSTIQPGTTPSYQLTVTGSPAEGGDPIEASATIQVIPNREISLVFEDGSKIKDLSTDDGHADATMLLTNEGTATEDVEITTTVPEQVGWDVQLLDATTGEPVPDGVIRDLEPNQQRRLTLDVNAPGDTARVVTIDVTAQSTRDASVASEVTARVAHGVSVDVSTRVLPDLVTLNPGDTTQVNLTMENHGSPVNVQVNRSSAEGLFLDPARTSVNLGENGSDADEATVPINLTVSQDAPIGGVLVSTIALEIRVGELDPIESLMSVRVRVVPQHGLEATGALTVLPGIQQQIELDVRATGDADEDVALDLLEVPRGWSIQAPSNLTVPKNATAPVRLNVTTPAGAQAGSYDLALLATPRDGTEPVPIRTTVAVDETAAFDLTAPDPLTLGLGANRTLQLSIVNQGNTPGETTIEATSSLVDARLRPATLTLGPGQRQNVSLELTATDTGTGEVALTSPPGGNTTLPVTVGRVELGIELVSTTPSAPSADEAYRAVVRVSNSGDVTAHDVDVALMSGQETLKTERIGRLAAGQSATLSVAVNELPTEQDLRVQIDPDGRYTQETVTDDSLSLSSDDVPMPPVAVVIALIALASVALRRT